LPNSEDLRNTIRNPREMERYLKYGDQIMFYSAEEPVKFLSARSWQEGEVYLLEG